LRFEKIRGLKRSNIYSIAFKGLKEGIHEFEFPISDVFFELLDYSELKSGKGIFHIALEKRQRLMVIYLTIKGEVLVTCDRCLDEFMMPIKSEFELYVKYNNDRIGEEETAIEDDSLYIDESDDYIDVHHYLYECIVLSIPMQRVHPKDKKGHSLCNKVMIDKLKAINSQGNTNKNNDNSLWEKLKDIKE